MSYNAAFRRGTWLIKLDSRHEPQWRDLSNETWHVDRAAPITVLAHAGEYHEGLHSRTNRSLQCGPSVGDDLSMATDRPHSKHLPLVRTYFM